MSNNFGGANYPVGSNLANTGGVVYEDDLSRGAVPQTGHNLHSSSGPAAYTQAPPATSSLGSSAPTVTDVGLNTGGQSTSDKVKEVNSQPTSGVPGSSASPGARGTTGIGSPPPTGTVYEQASRGAQVAANKAQELTQPIQPYIQKAQETVGPYVQQAKEVASPYVEKASALAQQGYQATATELDKRGVNLENTQQKLADVSQNLKDYGAVGQARAGEYLQQAVNQAQTIGADKENKNIFATIFGTIALIWLAFGLSITALLALGIAGTIAAVLSRYTRASTGKHDNFGQAPTHTGVETHYPNPSHPDNSLNR